MKPLARLQLIIITASLLPTLAIVWSRYDQRSERAADAALAAALAQRSAPFLASPDDCNEWLIKHPRHPLAPELRRILSPSELDQLSGTTHRARALAALLGSQPVKSQP
jgi:hypothetical protein